MIGTRIWEINDLARALHRAGTGAALAIVRPTSASNGSIIHCKKINRMKLHALLLKVFTYKLVLKVRVQF